MKFRAGALICVATIFLAVPGCSKKAPQERSAIDELRMTYTEPATNMRFDNTDMRRQVFDMNNDGTVDLWKYYSFKKTSDTEGEGEMVIARKELDLNFDGRIDRLMFYNQKENLIREEIDTNFDGIIDRIHHYDNNLINKTEFFQSSCNQVEIDGQNNPEVHPNLIRFYRQGTLTREEIDVACDGIRESVIIFNANGEIAQTGQDNNGDGIIELWTRY